MQCLLLKVFSSDSLGWCQVNERKLLGWWWWARASHTTSARRQLLEHWMAGKDDQWKLHRERRKMFSFGSRHLAPSARSFGCLCLRFPSCKLDRRQMLRVQSKIGWWMRFTCRVSVNTAAWISPLSAGKCMSGETRSSLKIFLGAFICFVHNFLFNKITRTLKGAKNKGANFELYTFCFS